MLDDVTLALLGDRAAQERITARGIIIPCHRCGGEAEISSKLYIEGQKPVYYWNITCKTCNYKLNGYGSRYIVLSSGKAVPEDGIDGRYRTIKLWNARAPILSAEEMEVLKRERKSEG